MPDTNTPNYGLTKPEIGASGNTWGGKMNANLDAIDAALKTIANGLAAAMSASGYTAADVLAKLLTVDGSGSGLDADKLDGLDASGFASAAHTHTAYVQKAFGSGRLFATAGGPDPTSQPGDIWICWDGTQRGLYIRDPGNVLRTVVDA